MPISYSMAGKIKGIDSGVGITIVSVAVYGTFIGAPASLGLLANLFGVNNVFTPTLLIFILLLIPLIIFKMNLNYKNFIIVEPLNSIIDLLLFLSFTK